MKFDAQTLMMLALVGFVLMRKDKKTPSPIEEAAEMAKALAKLATLIKTVDELKARVEDLHAASPSVSGYG